MRGSLSDARWPTVGACTARARREAALGIESGETGYGDITPGKSRYILLAENGNLPRNNAPRLSTASPDVTSAARGPCRASSESRLHPGSLCAAGVPSRFPRPPRRKRPNSTTCQSAGPATCRSAADGHAEPQGS